MIHSYRPHLHAKPAEKNRQAFFSKALLVQAKEDKTPFFQARGLTIGQAGDKYEREADAVADQVVNQSFTETTIHKKEISSIQRVTLATPQEDEKLDTAEQRMEEDKLVQEKPEDKKEKKTGMIQHKAEGSGNTAAPALSNRIESTRGKGRSLPSKTRRGMESSFGADFSQVSIHTDEHAVQMNKSLGAQAFTHGQDIYFNSGKYHPETSAGKHLLAHELTHVVQQEQKHLPTSTDKP